MARALFGGGAADFVQRIDTDGAHLLTAPATTVTFYTARTGGVQITDLQDLTSSPITSVVTDNFGALPQFYGPADGRAMLWADAGGGRRQLLLTSAPVQPVTTTGPFNTNQTLTARDYALADLSLGNLTFTLPQAPPDNTRVGAKVWVLPNGSSNILTIVPGVGDTINGSASSNVFRLLYQGATLQYNAALATWVRISDDLSLTQLIALMAEKPINSSNTPDRIYFVSKNGSDTANDGLSRGTAFATVDKAMATMNALYGGAVGGEIRLGYGTFPLSNPTWASRYSLVGGGRFNSVLSLATTGGTLLNLNGVNDLTYRGLGFTFGSGVTSGTLAALSNCFGVNFYDCGFFGLWAATAGSGGVGPTNSGQVGVSLTNNAGDNNFYGCDVFSCGQGFYVDTTLNHVWGGRIGGNKVGMTGGDVNGVNYRAGMGVHGATFLGAGDAYINILGTSAEWFIDSGAWFDGGATDAIIAGTATGNHGPRRLTLTNIANLAGLTRSLTINAAEDVRIDEVLFGDGGSHPNELTINSAVANGLFGRVRSLQGNDLTQRVPRYWKVTALPTDMLVARTRRTSGTITISNNAAFTALATDGSVDLTVNTRPGDRLRLYIAGMFGSEAPLARLDAATMVGGNPRAWASSGTTTANTGGVPTWGAQTASVANAIGSSCTYVVQAADIVSTAYGGQVTFRFYGRLDTGSSGSRTLVSTTATPLELVVENLG